MQNKKNLHDVLVMDDYKLVPQVDNGIETEEVSVYFKNIEDEIVKRIKKSAYVFGCVAWLTNKKILKALQSCEDVVIVVQEEDFLRPDKTFNGNKEKWKEYLKELYDKLKGDAGGSVNYKLGITEHGSWDTGIRRCGYTNKEKAAAFPRMHNKFIICFEGVDDDFYEYKHGHEMSEEELAAGTWKKESVSDGEISEVFCKFENHGHELIDNFWGGEVITGSFNHTENGNDSLENIVCLKQTEVVKAYMKEFKQILVMSIPLDWEREWNPCENELRYGS